MGPFEILPLLHSLGYGGELSLKTWLVAISRSESVLSKALRDYQRYHNLPQTGQPDDATRRHLAQPRCGRPDVQAASETLCQWPMRDLTYYQDLRYPGVDPMVVAKCYDDAWGMITNVCGVTAAKVSDPSQARVVAVVGEIDGPGNILAESELPCGFSAESVVHQTFDSGDGATSLADPRLMTACMVHEIGHALGLSHATPGSGNIMEPIISSAILSPQSGDISELQSRYGPPAGTATVTVPAAPSPVEAVKPVTINLGIPEVGQYELTLRYVGPTPAGS
jgi:hypothetical protein